jgi:succinyl-diaminopimelate desuccinylase
MTTTLQLARQLLGFNTINPPGSEADCMRFFADWLQESGFEVSLSSFGEGRSNLIASLPGMTAGKPLALPDIWIPCRWERAVAIRSFRFADGGRASLWTRRQRYESSGGGVCRRLRSSAGNDSRRQRCGIADYRREETGCDGARALIASATLPEIGALIVGEPTANYPVIGHKGALWLRCETRGKTAHGAMPELGINAIYLAADALGKIQHFSPGAPHPLMKQPTLNVGRIEGGLNINSVPDRTRFDVDIRSAPNLQHATIRQRLTTLLGESVTVSTLVDLPAVLSEADHVWIKQVYQRCQPLHDRPLEPRVVPYFTDASLLLPALGNPPCIILGPGEPSLAHQTDEYCLLSRLEEAEQLYGEIIRDWMR